MEWLEPLMAVLGVLGLMAAALLGLRRLGAGSLAARPVFQRGERKIEVLERQALSPQHSLHLVRVMDRVLLLSVSPGGCTPIAYPGELKAPPVEAPAPAVLNPPDRLPNGAAELLASLRSRVAAGFGS